jgi:N-acetylmuramoyl-L-alanine amidase
LAAVLGSNFLLPALAALALAGSHAPAHPTAVRPTPLAGKVVGIDPGHNGGNFSDPSFINSPVWNGREEEACDTTGTETDGGYTEALFNFNVASYLRRDLIAAGARVVMTRRTNDGPASPAAPRSSIRPTPTWRSTSTPTAGRRQGAASRSSPRCPTVPTTR